MKDLAKIEKIKCSTRSSRKKYKTSTENLGQERGCLREGTAPWKPKAEKQTLLQRHFWERITLQLQGNSSIDVPKKYTWSLTHSKSTMNASRQNSWSSRIQGKSSICKIKIWLKITIALQWRTRRRLLRFAGRKASAAFRITGTEK